jgi:endoglucanase
MKLGGPIHVGEWGCYNKTPHEVCLAWMSDLLTLWSEAGWGWAMWNMRGDFGVLDSGRSDVAYEKFYGHQLDRKMLELLIAN